jgi:hypothetical protein
MHLVLKRGLPGGVAAWDVVGQPFLMLVLPTGWLLLALDADARSTLMRHDLLDRRFTTCAAAIAALSIAVAYHTADPDLIRDEVRVPAD